MEENEVVLVTVPSGVQWGVGGRCGLMGTSRNGDSETLSLGNQGGLAGALQAALLARNKKVSASGKS